MLGVQLESDLCRVEQIFIPDTQTSLCCSTVAPRHALKNTPATILLHPHNVFFVPEGSRTGGAAQMCPRLQLLEHVALLFTVAGIVQTPSSLKYIGYFCTVESRPYTTPNTQTQSSAVNPHSCLWCRADCLKLNWWEMGKITGNYTYIC